MVPTHPSRFHRLLLATILTTIVMMAAVTGLTLTVTLPSLAVHLPGLILLVPLILLAGSVTSILVISIIFSRYHRHEQGEQDEGDVALRKQQDILFRSEHARRAVEIRWEALFQSAAEAILIGDEEGVLTCNPRFASLTGVAGEDLVGVPVRDLPFRSVVNHGECTLEEIWNRECGPGESFIWKITLASAGNSRECILDVNLKFVRMDGRMLRFLITRDITEEIRLRDEQEDAIRQIDKNLGQLAALNDEIRNPLTMIAAWTGLDHPPSHDKIMEGVQRINAIIDRIDTGYVESEKVRKYLQRSIDRYRPDPVEPAPRDP